MSMKLEVVTVVVGVMQVHRVRTMWEAKGWIAGCPPGGVVRVWRGTRCVGVWAVAPGRRLAGPWRGLGDSRVCMVMPVL
jgi:hypothetical protein